MGTVSYLTNRGRSRRDEPAQAPPSPHSIARPGYNCSVVARAERFALLIDGEAYFRAFYHAALRAERSILILGWDFNSRTRLRFDAERPGDPPQVLGEFLNWLVRRRRRLQVRILDWDYPIVFGLNDREFPPHLNGFGWTPARRVHLRYDDTHPVGGCQHQKIVVIDDALAFVGGIDLTARRWDTHEHLPNDPRRVAYGKPYPPFHDAMAAIDGEAARALAGIARERWQRATGRRLKARAPSGDPWPEDLAPDLSGVEVAIARTVPPGGDAPAVREVEKLYLDLIASAKRSLYIENQYFTEPRIAGALAARLEEPDGPEIVLVLRLLSHGWLEEHTMHVLRARLIETLRRADRHGRFHVYCPHIDGLAPGTCLDVHSKLMVVDDSRLRVGSSNIAKRSMGVDTECDVLIEARGEARVEEKIRELRAELIAGFVCAHADEVRAAVGRAGSLHGAIEALSRPERGLRPLTDLPDWPEAVVNMVSLADPAEPISLERLTSERQTTREASRRRPAWGKLWAIALGIVALFGMWRFTPVHGAINAQSVIAWARGLAGQPFAPILLVAAYTPAAFTMFPRPLITIAAAIAFGPWIGFGLAMAGILLSAAATYFAGRKMRRDRVRRLAGERLDQILEVIRARGLVAVTLLRLVPLSPFPVLGVVAGAVRMRLWELLVGTFIGMLPGVLAITIFGDQLGAAIDGHGHLNWWVIGGVLAALVAGALAVRRWLVRMVNVPGHGAPRDRTR